MGYYRSSFVILMVFFGGGKVVCLMGVFKFGGKEIYGEVFVGV